MPGEWKLLGRVHALPGIARPTQDGQVRRDPATSDGHRMRRGQVSRRVRRATPTRTHEPMQTHPRRDDLTTTTTLNRITSRNR